MQVRGRLAPSPSGLLHLGNAWAFFLAWLDVRKHDGKLVLRIEDIDPQRSKTHYINAIIEDLRWLGLDWDEGPDIGGDFGPYIQSQRYNHYTAALNALNTASLTYPCFCTRKELRAIAGAPHVGDAGAFYPGTCRYLSAEQQNIYRLQGRRPAIRIKTDDHQIIFADKLRGDCNYTLQEVGGDFALCRSDGVFAYQLAVTVDDSAMQINHVVRGNDILPSTPRQIYLAHQLGYSIPQYYHIPLILDENGERLAKRHQSLSLRVLRDYGIRAEEIINLFTRMAGMPSSAYASSPYALCKCFDWNNIPDKNIRISAPSGSILPNIL